MTARAWIHKLDTYLALPPMTKADAIRFVVLILDRVAHDWWYHGLVSLHHDQIISYQEFVDRLIEPFDKKDPEVYFRELAQLRQTIGLEAFIREFQRFSVMVYDIFEQRRVMFFIEGLVEPFRGWVESLDPPSL